MKIDDFKAAVQSIDRWTLNGCYNFLKEESALKKLMLVARYDSFNSNAVVTVSDNGSFRVFNVNDGKVERTSKIPDYCKQWRIQTGGRSGIAYRKGGFAPEGGIKRPVEKNGDGPVPKRRWGARDENRGQPSRRGGYRR